MIEYLKPLYLLVGAYMIFKGINQFRKRKKLEKKGIHTTGEIVKVESGIDKVNGGVYYTTTFKFKDSNNQIVTVFDKHTSKIFNKKPGTKVKVIYNPDNPKDARIDDSNLKMELLLIGAGILFVTLIVIVFY